MRRGRRSPHPLAFAMALPLALLASACGGSPSAPPMTTISFTPTVATPPANSISLAVSSVSSSALALEVDVNSVTGAASVFFDLVFNPAVFQYSSATVGPFLGTSGGSAQITVPTDPALVAAVNTNGRLPVSVNVIPATMSASGSGALCTIELAYSADGSSSFTFERTGVLMAFPGNPVPGVQFVGGSATATTR